MKTLLTKTITVPDHAAMGLHLRGLRRSSGKSLRNIATHLEVSASYLSDLELGKRNWTQARVDQFLKALPIPERRKSPSSKAHYKRISALGVAARQRKVKGK